MNRISNSISRKLFLPVCSRCQIHSELAHDYDLGTNKKKYHIKNQERLCFLFNFFQNMMVVFKVKIRALAHFTKLGSGTGLRMWVVCWSVYGVWGCVEAGCRCGWDEGV